jgi:general secretion pathway protein G
LLELLVVVGIIAILAAIALPNLQAARVRSKVARVQADLNTLATALECYAVDNNVYPLNAGGIGLSGALTNLVSPTSYIAKLPPDVFLQGPGYAYFASGRFSDVLKEPHGSYRLSSVGPDGETTPGRIVVYDPTNGVVSGGDILVTHRSKDPAAIAARAASGDL